MTDGAEAVREAFPGRSVEFEGRGQLSSAWRVDDELVVRVPHHAFGIDRLRFEVALLASIADRLGPSIPEIVDVALDLPVGRAYVAHRRIPGRVLRPEDVVGLTPDRVEAVGRQVGRFVQTLHSIGPGDVAGVPVQTAAEFAASLRAEVDALLGPRIDVDRLAALHHDLAELERVPSEPLVLAHTDIGGNIIVDEGSRVGIIDFGSAFITHPAFDVASLSVLGEDISRAAADEYPLLGAFDREARLVANTFFLQDALYGARQENWPYVDGIFATGTSRIR